MEPGRDMDARIAILLFGWRWQSFNPREGLPAVATYSTDIGAAWAVVEKLRDLGFMVRVQEMPDNYPYYANAVNEPDQAIHRKTVCIVDYLKGMYSNDPEERAKHQKYRRARTTYSDSTPHAICLAALRVFGVEGTSLR